jgi:hypothetical protein
MMHTMSHLKENCRGSSNSEVGGLQQAMMPSRKRSLRRPAPGASSRWRVTPTRQVRCREPPKRVVTHDRPPHLCPRTPENQDRAAWSTHRQGGPNRPQHSRRTTDCPHCRPPPGRGEVQPESRAAARWVTLRTKQEKTLLTFFPDVYVMFVCDVWGRQHHHGEGDVSADDSGTSAAAAAAAAAESTATCLLQLCFFSLAGL